jgi:hypothetical protein
MLEVLAPRALCRVPTVSGSGRPRSTSNARCSICSGCDFVGHPSLQRILCPDDWVGHPLRKDYVYPAQYHGVPHLREGQHFERAPRARQGDPEPAPTVARPRRRRAFVTIEAIRSAASACSSTWGRTIRRPTGCCGSASRATARWSRRAFPTTATCTARSRRSASASSGRCSCRTRTASTTSAR